MTNTRDARPFVLCLRADEPTTFTDNEYGVCIRCGHKVQHRPHVPTPNRLLCLDCFHIIADDEGGVIEYKLDVTPETIRELAPELKKLRDKDK